MVTLPISNPDDEAPNLGSSQGGLPEPPPIMGPEKPHCLRGPSSAARWKASSCPGSVELCRGLPGDSSADADLGTRAHDWCEYCLRYDKTPASGCEEMDACVQIFLDEVNRWRERYLVLEEWIEEFTVSTEIEDFGGTSDFTMLGIDLQTGKLVLHVIDYKHGVGVPVSAEDNDQLQAYMILQAEKVSDRKIEAYRGTIVQPRVPGKDEVETWECTPEHLAATKRDFAASPGDDTLRPSPKACQWCKAIAFCPAHKAKVLELAQMDFNELDNPSEETKAYWLQTLDIAKTVEQHLKAIPDAILNAMQKGEKFDGYKAIKQLSHTRWKEDLETTVKKLQRRGVPKKVSTTAKLLTPTQLKNLGYGEQIEDLSYRAELGYKVVKESARGEAVDFRTLDEIFEEVENGEE